MKTNLSFLTFVTLILLISLISLSGCSNQAIPISSEADNYQSCIDLDEGMNFLEKGHTGDKNGDVLVNTTDYCDESGKLVEFYCDPD